MLERKPIHYCAACVEWFDTEDQLAEHKVKCDIAESERKEKWLRFIDAYKALLKEHNVELVYIYAEGTEHTIDGKRIPYEWDNWSL